MQLLHTALSKCKIVPVVVVHDVAHAAPLANALANGGLTVVEVTMRTPAALDVISAMVKARPDLVTGAGTVLNAEHLQQARDAGAHFGVSPGTSAALREAIVASGWAFIPGCATPSEAMTLSEAGFEVVKLFPAEVVGGLNMLNPWQRPCRILSSCPQVACAWTKSPNTPRSPTSSPSVVRGLCHPHCLKQATSQRLRNSRVRRLRRPKSNDSIEQACATQKHWSDAAVVLGCASACEFDTFI